MRASRNLLHDLHALAHLEHADQVAVEAVAVLADRNVEIELRVALVRLRLAQVPRRARAAHHDAREAHANASSRLTTPMSTLRCLKMRLLGQQPFDVVEHLQERIAPGVDVVDQLGRKILMHAADAEILGVHARARGALIEHHQLLALVEAPQRRRQRADVHGLRGDVEQMREMAADLGDRARG